MPLSNWFGWYVTGVIIARLALAFAPPTLFAARISPTWLPIILYAVNGIMPIALCVRDDMIWGAVFGTIAMLIPVALAVKATPKTGNEQEAREPAPARIPRPA
jgi:putative membrane protein